MSVPPSVAEIMQQSARWHGVTVANILGPSRTRHVVAARRMAMARTRNSVRIKGKPASGTLIGRWFQRDHSTVWHACDVFARLEAERLAA